MFANIANLTSNVIYSEKKNLTLKFICSEKATRYLQVLTSFAQIFIFLNSCKENL